MTPEILLVNDDGIESPALLPTLEALNEIGDVTAVIPSKQQSWTSKINTRISKEVTLESVKIGNFDCFKVDLYPADCTNLGIYLKETKPDLVVSGANVGHNVGLHAFFSSGTVGAAIEGVIAGIPSIAISCAYKPKQDLNEENFRKSLQIIPKLIQAFLSKTHEISLLNVNLPLGKTCSEIKSVSVDNFCFGSLFDVKDNIVSPKHYYSLNTPVSDKVGVDTWARKTDQASISAFNSYIQEIDQQIISEWLKSNDL